MTVIEREMVRQPQRFAL